ncbi:hypothetical protein HUJ04_010858 [Dendroctonus ponderosae]|nr:hypothetical protein HUJ04_010858 [Dendroctonus ponderosae]
MPKGEKYTCPRHNCKICFHRTNRCCVLCLNSYCAYHANGHIRYDRLMGFVCYDHDPIICPKHKPRSVQPINTGWCFICSEGGNLVCCDTCPTSVHPECQPVNFTDDDKYVCEDCESGRFPLYDEVVWVKLGQYRWWPALILFPNEVPLNVRLLKHKRGDFVVRFFAENKKTQSSLLSYFTSGRASKKKRLENEPPDEVSLEHKSEPDVIDVSGSSFAQATTTTKESTPAEEVQRSSCSSSSIQQSTNDLISKCDPAHGPALAKACEGRLLSAKEIKFS